MNEHVARCFGANTPRPQIKNRLLVQLADWASAQNALDSYITMGGAASVIDALEAPGGDSALDVTVETVDNYGHISIGDQSYGSVTFTALVLT